MTVTPMGHAPTTDRGASPARRGGDGSAAAEGFGALVAAQLAAVTAQTAPVAGSPGSVSAANGPSDPASAADADETSASAGMVDILAGSLPAATVTTAAGEQPTAAGSGAGTVEGAEVAELLAAGSTAIATGAGVAMLDADASVATNDADAEADIDTVAGRSASPTAATSGASLSASSSAPALVDGAGAADGRGTLPSSAGPTASGTTPGAAEVTAAGRGDVPVTGLATTTTPVMGSSPSAAGTPAGQVTAQVYPTVPTLVTRGEGTHSLLLRLHPADLGEVHVTVTVRDGAVDVTLAAGREAQQALRNGVGELRSLIDLAGATSGQVIVRDLPTGVPPTTPTVSSAGQGGSFQLPTGQGSPEHAHDQAGGRGDSDHGPDRRGRPGGAPTDDPVPTRVRTGTSAGLDVVL